MSFRAPRQANKQSEYDAVMYSAYSLVILLLGVSFRLLADQGIHYCKKVTIGLRGAHRKIQTLIPASLCRMMPMSGEVKHTQQSQSQLSHPHVPPPLLSSH